VELLLYSHGTLHGIYHTRELGQEIVAGRVHHPASVLLDQIEECLFVGFEGGNGSSLIVLHQTTVASYVGAENGCELAVKAFLFHADTSLSRRFGK
jgi:hypothetical protein